MARIMSVRDGGCIKTTEISDELIFLCASCLERKTASNFQPSAYLGLVFERFSAANATFATCEHNSAQQKSIISENWE